MISIFAPMTTTDPNTPGVQPVNYHPNVRVERDGHVTTVTIDQPKSKNACTGDMWVAIGATFRDLASSGARVVVLTGAGGDFCAGADLGGGDGDGDGDGDGRPGGNQLDAMRVLGDVVLAVHGCPVPVIAKVDGVCVGAGLGLALAADMTWCSDRARFSAIFAKRGLSLDFGTSWLLRQRVGAHVAKQMAFTAEMISGPRAHELGFVNAVTPVADLDRVVDELARTIAAGPPIALSMTKRELDHAASGSLAQALEAEALAQSVNVNTEDLVEAMTAFMERRAPEFKGR
jgi:enoyl-CoA hydratase/carnithine racemase